MVNLTTVFSPFREDFISAISRVPLPILPFDA